MAQTRTSAVPNSTANRRPNQRQGFSLLELLVVLVLVALVSATVAMKWSGVRREATLEAAISQLEFWDTHMRRYANAHGTTCRLAFNLKTHQIGKQYHDHAYQNPAAESFGRGIQIKQLNVGGQRSRSRESNVNYHHDGTSDTYGITFTATGDRQVWLIVAGTSGQVTRLESQRDYDTALQLLTTPS